jgi:NADH dehydrogenase
VRSTAAARTINAGAVGPVDTAIIDYTNVAAMTRAAEGCTQAVHLVGILKASARNTYAAAHEATCRALVAAAQQAGLHRIVYVSILGSDPSSRNACLASKGRAERILLEGPVPAVVLRVPMVLGENDYASRSLAGRARARRVVMLRAASREQPIDARDVVEGIVAALERPGLEGCTFDLAGPESLSRADLVRRAGRVVGGSPSIVSLPLGLGLAAAAVAEAISREPPVTRAMLGVLDHDDDIDPRPAATRLGIALTPLDDTLRSVLAHEQEPRKEEA